MWFAIFVNPEPWAIGDLAVGKKNGKFYPYIGPNHQLVAYKQAVIEELQDQGVSQVPYESYHLKFFFWRRLDTYRGGRKHLADATNLQKATEDALQGTLIGNDRDVRSIYSEIVSQGPDVKPCVIISVDEYLEGINQRVIPEDLVAAMRAHKEPGLSDNVWRGPGG